MSQAWLLLFILSSLFGISLTVGGKIVPETARWKNNLLLGLGCSQLLALALLGWISYHDNLRSKQQANEKMQLLSDQIVSLKAQNQALNDQISDSNARTEAIRTRLGANANFSRRVSDTHNTQDSLHASK